MDAHPLAAVVPVVRELLGEVAQDARHLAVLADADGLLLWSEGHPSMAEAAAKPHFMPGWLTAPLLFTGGVGHAWGFSPLATRLTAAVDPSAAADMSGFILTASLIGQGMGVATFTGIYLSQSGQQPQSALAITTGVIAAVSIITAACGKVAVARRRAVPVSASA